MRLELEWLRSWIAVVDSGGFARAGTAIHLSQPRVSAHVAQLETSLGCKLIDRQGRPLTLTGEGERFLPRARAIMAALADAVSDVSAVGDEITGRLTIASFASASSAYIPALLRQLRLEHPHLDPAIIDADLRSIESFLTERRAEVAIRPFRPAPIDRRLEFRPLWREGSVALLPLGHRLLAYSSLTLEQVLRHAVITVGDPLTLHPLGDEVWTALRSSMLQPHGGIVAHQPTTLAALVRGGHGIGLVNQLAGSMVRTDGLEQRPVINDQLTRDVGIWWRADQPLSRAAEAFIEAAKHAPRPAGTIPVVSGATFERAVVPAAVGDSTTVRLQRTDPSLLERTRTRPNHL